MRLQDAENFPLCPDARLRLCPWPSPPVDLSLFARELSFSDRCFPAQLRLSFPQGMGVGSSVGQDERGKVHVPSLGMSSVVTCKTAGLWGLFA